VSGGTGTGVLMAQPFDLRKLELSGDALPVIQPVATFAISPTGVLVYRAPIADRRRSTEPTGNPPTWFDRQGKTLGAAVEPGSYGAMAISPDGKRLATSRIANASSSDLWVHEFARKSSSRFTFDSGSSTNPVWSPDGSRIAFSANPTPWNLYVKASNGAGEAELLLRTPESKNPTSWSRDGRFLLYHNLTGDEWVLPMKDGKAAADSKPFLFAAGASGGKFSPDMRWIAYLAQESGQSEIWVRPFDAGSPTGAAASGGKWMVSRGGATSLRWRGDGKELFYAAPDGTIMSVEVNTSPSSPVFDAGVPKPLFKGAPLLGIYWDVSSDGQRFLLSTLGNAAQQGPPVSSAPYRVVLNWTSLLKR